MELDETRSHIMIHRVQFISLEEDEKDLILSFVVEDGNMGVKTLLLHRTLFFEELLDDEERGVIVSLEDDELEPEKEYFNTLTKFRMHNDKVEIISRFREYTIDVSRIEKSDIKDMVKLLKRQNFDSRFIIEIT